MATFHGTLSAAFTTSHPSGTLASILEKFPRSAEYRFFPATEQTWGVIVTCESDWDVAPGTDPKTYPHLLIQDFQQRLRGADDLVLTFDPSPAVPAEPALKPQEPATGRLVLRGVVINASMDGGPLGGAHITVERPSSRWPWRLPVTEGVLSNIKSTWAIPCAEKGEREIARELLGSPIRITVERDPDAKY